MKYTYLGKNPDYKVEKKLEFEDDQEAIEYGVDNASEYPKFTIKDEDGEIIWSDKLQQDEEDAAIENMYPEGQDE
jgi:hypothetical protein